tara:strand:- start:171 stop:557 length:387 start_codon:yes stop_codon:yes gene_type:complete
MFFWGLLLLAQAPSPVVTKLVMEPDCHIPAAPPCIPFDDPRWKVEGCRIDDGACFVLQVEQKSRPDVNAEIRISPGCGEKGSKKRLMTAALKALFKTKYDRFTFEERVLKCSKSGYADVRLTVKEEKG